MTEYSNLQKWMKLMISPKMVINIIKACPIFNGECIGWQEFDSNLKSIKSATFTRL